MTLYNRGDLDALVAFFVVDIPVAAVMIAVCAVVAVPLGIAGYYAWRRMRADMLAEREGDAA